MVLICKEGETISNAEFPAEIQPLVEHSLEKNCKYNCPKGICRARQLNGPWIVRAAINETQQETSRYLSYLLKQE